MLCFDSLTDVTFGDVASDLSLHLVPPKLLFQILIHLCSSRVDRIKSIMSFFQNNFFQLRICWYTKASFVPQNSFFVFGESGYFACTDTTLDSVDTSISFLCLFDPSTGAVCYCVRRTKSGLASHYSVWSGSPKSQPILRDPFIAAVRTA